MDVAATPRANAGGGGRGRRDGGQKSDDDSERNLGRGKVNALIRGGEKQSREEEKVLWFDQNQHRHGNH